MRQSKALLSCLPKGCNITPLIDGSFHASIIVMAPTPLAGERTGVPPIVCLPPGWLLLLLLLLLLGGGLVGGEWGILVFSTLDGRQCGAVLKLLIKGGGRRHVVLELCTWVKEGQGLTFGSVLFVQLCIKMVLSKDNLQLGV